MKLRILMVISQFYPLLGGAEQQALNLAKGLMRNGIEVSILTRQIKGLSQFEEIQGIPVYRSIRTVPAGKLFGLFYFITVFLFLLKMKDSYDIIHCHLAQGFHSPAALLMKALFKKKVIIKIGATGPLSDFRMLQDVLFGNFFLRQLQHADRIIVVCDQASREAQRAGIPFSSIVQVPNGVDIEHFKPSSDCKKKNIITFAGRLDYMKGIHVLLEAFKMLKQKEGDILLHIIGDGPDKKKLLLMAEKLGIKDFVVFYGEVHDISPLLRESAVFVLPSLSEGLSNVVLEAMACGLPVVATKVGGNGDIIKDGVNGTLVEPEKPQQLSDALEKIIRTHGLAIRMGFEARATVEERFALDMIIERYGTLYSEVLAQ